jgi:GGDEF domain-containing protein
LDRIKHINDSRGHETGDKMLKEVAARILATVHA